MFASEGEVTSGEEVDFTGQVHSAHSECTGQQEFVRLRRRQAGESSFSDFKSTLTNTNGRFEFNGVEIVHNADYVAVAPAHDSCGEATSDPPTTVLAKGRVTIRANDKTPTRGKVIRLKGSVSPNHRNSKVRLQQRRGGGWETVDGAKLSRASGYVFEFEAVGPKTQRYRVHWLGAADNEAATSPELKLVLHK